MFDATMHRVDFHLTMSFFEVLLCYSNFTFYRKIKNGIGHHYNTILVEAKFNNKIERHGEEYVSKDFQTFCTQKGILAIQYTVPRNPEQNGVAERFNRTVIEKARCLIFDTNMEKELWGEAIRTAIYLINRTETSILPGNKTPAEIWYRQKPNLEKFRVFGCDAYSYNSKE